MIEILGKFIQQHIVAIVLAALGIGTILRAISERTEKERNEKSDDDDDFQRPFALT
jgi:hypothetical protein